MRGIKETSIEKKLYQELKNRGLLFEKQKIINGKNLIKKPVVKKSLNIWQEKVSIGMW